MQTYLPEGLPKPVPAEYELDAPFWEGLRAGRLMVQRCTNCQSFQMPPEWVCHVCRAFTLGWQEVAPRGGITSWERIWHPVHPALQTACPYLVVVVELAEAGDVRLVGNLLGNPLQSVRIGAAVEGVFEDHGDAGYALLQWRTVGTDM